MLWLLLVAGLSMSALVYPWRLADFLLAPLESRASGDGFWAYLYQTQLRGQLTFAHSPLIYKESVAGAYLLTMLLVLLLLKLLQALLPAAPSLRCQSPREWATRLVRDPYVWVVALLAYLGISALWLSPTIHYSLRTLLMYALGIFFFLSFMELSPSRRVLRRFMFLMCGCGAVVALVSLMQHTGTSSWFLPPLQDRNRVGSLIGHNTGVSSWLLFPLSFSVYFGLNARGRLGRVASWGLTLLILCVLVAAQSRAVWVLVLVGLPLYGWAQCRQAGVKLRMKHGLVALAVVASIVALQSVAPGRNPFARGESTLAERVEQHMLNADQLLRETRLRILVASMPLVAQRPLLGYGLGAFQYVYPPAQGQYFREHPDTHLGTTAKRTDLAHNDYLQLLVEGGLIGLVLQLVPLCLFLRRGWRGYCSLGVGQERAAANALLFPMTAIALHAWVDFPMHLVPIALAEAACLALWASLAWLPAGQKARQLEPVLAEGQAAAGGSQTVRWKASLLLAATLFAAGWSLSVAGPFVLREFLSDIYMADGNNWLFTFHAMNQAQVTSQYEALHKGWQMFNRAIKLNVFNGPAYEGIVQTYLGQGNLDYSLLRSALSRGDTKNVEAWRQGARRNYELAQQYSKAQLEAGELRYHFTYYQLGEAYLMLSRLERDVPGKQELARHYLASAKNALEAAVAVNTADSASMLELANLLEEQQPPDVVGANRWRLAVFRVDPVFASTQYLGPVVSACDRGDFVTAYRRYERLARLAPEEWRTKLTRAELSLREALWPPPELDKEPASAEGQQWQTSRLKSGAALLGEVERENPDEVVVKRLRLLYESALGNYARALTIADELVARYPNDWDTDVLRHELALRLGQKRNVAQRLIQGTEGQRRIQRYRLFYFGQRNLGAGQLANLAGNGVKLDVGEGLRAAAFLEANGQWKLVEKLADGLMHNYPADTAVTKLWQEVRQHSSQPTQAGAADTSAALTAQTPGK